MRVVREPKMRPRTLAFWRAVAAGRITLTPREDATTWRLRAAGHSWNWIADHLIARRADLATHPAEQQPSRRRRRAAASA